MKTVAFSSWNGKIVDNRKGLAAKAAKADQKIPDQVAGKNIAALMGWNGLVVTDPKADIPSLAIAYLKEARKLSCGECSVCMIGIDRVLDILGGMSAGRGSKQDIQEIETVAKGVAANAKCNFGRAAALTPVLDAVKYFKADFAAPAGKKAAPEAGIYQSAVSAPCMQACPI